MAGTPTEIETFRNTATSIALGALAARQESQLPGDDVYELLDELASTASYLGMTEVLYLDQFIGEDAIDHRKQALAAAAAHGRLDAEKLRREIRLLTDFEWIDEDVLLTSDGYRATIRDEQIVPVVYDVKEHKQEGSDNFPDATHFVRRHATIREALDDTGSYEYELIPQGPRITFGTLENGLFVPA